MKYYQLIELWNNNLSEEVIDTDVKSNQAITGKELEKKEMDSTKL